MLSRTSDSHGMILLVADWRMVMTEPAAYAWPSEMKHLPLPDVVATVPCTAASALRDAGLLKK